MRKRHSVRIILCARYRWPFILTSENKLEMFSKTLCKTLYLRSATRGNRDLYKTYTFVLINL